MRSRFAAWIRRLRTRTALLIAPWLGRAQIVNYIIVPPHNGTGTSAEPPTNWNWKVSDG